MSYSQDSPPNKMLDNLLDLRRVIASRALVPLIAAQYHFASVRCQISNIFAVVLPVQFGGMQDAETLVALLQTL